ncbi:MAG: hypothetical protein H6977_08280 [Gammaproteobacteria bacterium]|nr:hypothetical protein [Gammaproteobacteria bacterium]MCP5199996.1 hypothetical protein [Gammaproteobacteria bacterium]
MNKLSMLTLLGTVAAAIALPAAAQDVGPECRGVAAGTVAAMRAAGELPTQETVDAAVVAARRACAAALQDLGRGAAVAGNTDASAAAAEPAKQAAKDDDEDPSIWDLLTRDKDLKPGNERLRRLKTQ